MPDLQLRGGQACAAPLLGSQLQHVYVFGFAQVQAHARALCCRGGRLQPWTGSIRSPNSLSGCACEAAALLYEAPKLISSRHQSFELN